MTDNDKANRDDTTQLLGGVVQMFLVAGGVLLAYHLFLAPANSAVSTHSGAFEGVKVVDSKAVFSSFMDVMEDRIAGGDEFTEGQLNLKGQEFGAEYMRAIKKYRDAGYLVIDKQYVLGMPAGSDITQEIADALSLDIEPSIDPFSAPELE